MNSKKHHLAWQAILEELRRRVSNGATYEALGRLLGRDRAAVHNWLSGKRGAGQKTIDQMIEYLAKLGLDPGPYFGAGQDQGDYVRIPWLEAVASMGPGSLETSREVKSHLSFQAGWVKAKGNPKNMVVINADGDSMFPTIPDGAVVLLDESRTRDPLNDRIYLVCYRNEIFLKRLKVRDGLVEALISDNGQRQEVLDRNEYFKILGRAVWYGKDI